MICALIRGSRSRQVSARRRPRRSRSPRAQMMARESSRKPPPRVRRRRPSRPAGEGAPLRSTQSRRPGQEATGRRTRQRRTLQRESPFVAFPASQPHHHHRPSLVPTRRRPALRESPCLRKRRHLPCAWVPCAWDLLPCRSIRSTTALFSCRPCQARGQIPGDERPAALPRA